MRFSRSFAAVVFAAVTAASCQPRAENTERVAAAPSVTSAVPPSLPPDSRLPPPAASAAAGPGTSVSAISDYMEWLVAFDQRATQTIGGVAKAAQPAPSQSGTVALQEMSQKIAGAVLRLSGEFEQKPPPQECRAISDLYRKLLESKASEMVAMTSVGDACKGESAVSGGCAEAMGKSLEQVNAIKTQAAETAQAISVEAARLQTAHPDLKLPDFSPQL